MANTTAFVNKQCTWISTGTGDTLTCDDINGNRQSGVEIDSDSIAFENATITVTTKAGASKVVAAPASAGKSVLVGEGFAVSKIVISGMAAGTYIVHFTQ